jgi:rod shape-determining protein MreC
MFPRWVDRNLALIGGVLFAVVLLTVAQHRAELKHRQSPGGIAVAIVVSPLQRVLTGVSNRVSRTVGVFREIRTLYAQNQKLRGEVDRLRERNNRLNEAAIENQRLREMLGYRDQAFQGSQSARPATVIGVKPTNWFNTVTLDLGAPQGARPKQVVLTPRGLVGEVRWVTPVDSTVLLITDLGSGVGGRIQRTGWNGVVKGTGGPLLEMVFLPREADVRKGDLVVTSGMGSVFRVKGVVIGTVESVHLDENTSVKTATIRPAVDFRRLQEVFVLGG